jgi:hypothetical protein
VSVTQSRPCVAAYEAVERLLDARAPDNLVALAVAGLVGFGGNYAAPITPFAWKYGVIVMSTWVSRIRTSERTLECLYD